MANIDFPSSPTIGQQYTFAGVTYVFTAQGVWSPAAGGSTSTQFVPQGRLTLSAGSPIMLTTVNSSNIFYSLFNGNRVPIYNGTSYTGMVIGELTTPLNDTQYSPTSLVADSVYDWFIWRDGTVSPAVIRLSHGPAWTNKTTRSDGTQLKRVQGLLLNMSPITGTLGGPVAERGTYVGTTYNETANTLNWQIGGVGLKGRYHVWNAYNRINIGCTVNDVTPSWGYGTALWRISNSGTVTTLAPRVEGVFGLPEDSVDVSHVQQCALNGGSYAYAGIGMDWVSGVPSAPAVIPWGTEILVAHHIGVPAAGYHVWVALEFASGGITYYGTSTAAGQWAGGMSFNARM